MKILEYGGEIEAPPPLTTETTKDCISKVREMATLSPHSLAPSLAPSHTKRAILSPMGRRGP